MSSASPASKRRALLLDDYQEIIDNIAKLLRKLDCEVVSATEDAAAFSLFQESHFDFIIQDYHRPTGTGATFLRRIRNLEGSKSRVPVGILTGQSKETVVEGLARIGLNFDDEVFVFVNKPLDLDGMEKLKSLWSGEAPCSNETGN